MSMNAPEAGRVLSTLNEDGTRRWMRPRLSPGRFMKARRYLGWFLIAFFVSAPLIPINGHPMIFLDVAQRRFHLFGGTFLPTDSFLLMLLMMSIFLTIFWLTALFGRVWCGWGCPQTVYMEFLFRPIERLFEGGPTQQRAIDAKGGLNGRRLAKNVVFLFIAFLLANVFLAYFVGYSTLLTWVTEAPWVHPGGFGVVAVTTGLVFFDFAYFREQMCTVICPYARLQSGLLDRHSLIIGYDTLRGEARKKAARRTEGDGSGDCIDCHACVVTCPTGIDIRDGLQLECIACAQCVDACDTIMTRIGKPTGLIRYSSQESLETQSKPRKLRVRTVIYPAIITVLLSTMFYMIRTKADVDVTVLRQLSAPFVEDGDNVRNQLRVKVVNRADADRDFHISVPAIEAGQLLAPQNPLPVPAGHDATTPVFITLPRGAFKDGQKQVTVVVDDGKGFKEEVPFLLLGPKE